MKNSIALKVIIITITFVIIISSNSSCSSVNRKCHDIGRSSIRNRRNSARNRSTIRSSINLVVLLEKGNRRSRIVVEEVEIVLLLEAVLL